MKKLMSLCLLALILLLTGCSEKIPSVNTISVDKKGVVTYTVIEEFGKDFYDAEGLRADIEQEVGDYNRNFGTDPLTLKSLEVEDGSAVMQMQFTEARYYEDYYKAYSGGTLFVGTVKEAMDAGYDLAGEFMAADGALTDVSQLPKAESLKVLITSEALTVQVPGDIQCVSPSGSVEIVGKKEAVVSEEALQACIIYK